jgi:hypothetical protein
LVLDPVVYNYRVGPLPLRVEFEETFNEVERGRKDLALEDPAYVGDHDGKRDPVKESVIGPIDLTFNSPVFD